MGSRRGRAKGTGPRWLAITVVLACAAGLGAWAWRDVEARGERARADRGAALVTAADAIERLFHAEQASLAATLRGVRTELRAKDVWARPGAIEARSDGRPDSEAIDARRLEGALRRALESFPSVTALELVVAGHAGLTLVVVERGPEGIGARSMSRDAREGLSKALWYSDEVSRAVASSGRRVEHGEVAFEARPGGPDALGRPLTRSVIGLHEPGELVQGALIAVVDRTTAGTALSALVTPDLRLSLLSSEGRLLDGATSAEPAPVRSAALAVRVFEQDNWVSPFEADGLLVLGRPIGGTEKDPAAFLVLLEAEAPAPPVELTAWVATPWPVTLALSALVSILAVFGLATRGRGAAADAAGALAADDPAAAIEVHREDVVLREWLADVRGCLEREAAVRGLALDLRCERQAPADFTGDPAWLGGLVVAMGREALDATSKESVAVEVTSGSAGLRFEVEAGGVSLSPIAGMQTIARALGGRFESGHHGRLSLVVPTSA